MISVTIEGTEYRFFDHLYAVSRCGKVIRKLHPYTPTNHNSGYLCLGRHRLMHRVVAACWLEGFTFGKHVHHINGDKTDNRADNLECLTQKEHLQERHGNLLQELGRYIRSPETREKIRKYRTGRVTSDETKAKQRAALLGRKRPLFARAGHSDASKKERSLTHHRNTACRVMGVEYRSFAEAAKITGIHRFTLRKRCLSDNFSDYELC